VYKYNVAISNKITNGKLNWEMVVDGQTILFAGYDNTEYFIKHYGSLGYKVIVKD